MRQNDLLFPEIHPLLLRSLAEISLRIPWAVRQCSVGKSHTGKGTNGKALGFKTRSKPSKEAIKRHTLTIKEQLRTFRSASQEHLLKELSPIMWGWAAYYKTAGASTVFKRGAAILWNQLARWGKARHPDKGTHWMTKRYWHQGEKRKWVFATPTGAELSMHSKTATQRYSKVKGTASPYEGTMLYWSQRLKSHPMMHETKARLLQKQQGRWRWCELHFKAGDTLEVEHIDRNRSNNDLSNKMLLQRHCHAERHTKLAETEQRRKRLADAGSTIQ